MRRRGTWVTAGADKDSQTPEITPDGRHVVFMSAATNLVAGDTNNFRDIFVHDRLSGTTERVSVSAGGAQGNGNSYVPSITPDGRYIAFVSYATQLVPGDSNNQSDVFVVDRSTGAVDRVSVATGGGQANGRSYDSSISADGRYVAFMSSATNLVSGDTNEFRDVFVRADLPRRGLRIGFYPDRYRVEGNRTRIKRTIVPQLSRTRN